MAYAALVVSLRGGVVEKEVCAADQTGKKRRVGENRHVSWQGSDLPKEIEISCVIPACLRKCGCLLLLRMVGERNPKNPLESLARCAGETGVVLFDSAGNFPAGAEVAVSVLAREPQEILTGSIFRREDREKLRAAGGWKCGWVDYEGGFVFGVFPRVEKWEGTAGTVPAPAAGHAGIGDFRALMSREEFLKGVERAKGYIAAGDIYQVNLSQGFEAEVSGGSLFPLYLALREASPAPMAAWLSLGGREVLCSSPELFLKVTGGRIETRPIKGTRPRFSDPAADAAAAAELASSEKERAELVMITDLLRNDLGQVCEFGSVRVEAMLERETLAQVHHLVSTVTGELKEEMDAIEALAACFPGGSITGAPKKRAMEIIREIEGRDRGLYCGTIGWINPEGDATFNIVIRTLIREGTRLVYQVGAGIVADSDAEKEYEETLHKAAGIRLAVERAGGGK